MILSIAYVYSDTYAAWYEEPEIYETENVDSKWWLSRKQKEAERQKQFIELNKKIEENKNKDFKDKNIRWLYSDFDTTRFPKNKEGVLISFISCAFSVPNKRTLAIPTPALLKLSIRL